MSGVDECVVAGILLCAGRSRRMGWHKADLPVGSERALERQIRLLKACCDEVVVVVEPHRTDLAERAAALGATAALNPDPTDGPISSVRAALALPESGLWSAIAVLLVDLPGVRPESCAAVVDAFRADSDRDVVLPVSSGGPGEGERSGHPTLFSRRLFAELTDPALEGGARALVHADPGRVHRVDVADPGIFTDLDTPEEWAEAVESGLVAAPDPLGPGAAARISLEAAERGREVVVATRLEPLPPARMVLIGAADRSRWIRLLGSLGSPRVDAEVRDAALALLAGEASTTAGEYGGVGVYLEAHRPQSDLVIVGAGHISLPLAEVGRVLGFQVRVLDDRPDFARADRFPEGVEVRRVDFANAFDGVPIGPLTHLVLVTRGHRYDFECLRQLLLRELQPGYLGLIGSRRRVRATWAQLLEEGIERDRLARIHAPVGLDLGAETPAEIAVAVAAEIVRHRRGGTGLPLRDRERVLERFFPSAAAEEPR